MTRHAVCAWCGPVLVVIASVGFLLAGLLPVPLSPNASISETVAFYAEHPDRVRAGFVIASVAVGLIFPLVGLITTAMLRIEKRNPLLSFVQLATGAATGVLLLIPMLLFATAAFRPDRDPQLTVTLSDLGWLLFITPIAPFMIQNIAIGAAILGDKSEAPVLPRWVGYFNLFIAFTFAPDTLPYFLKTGPFAWNGVLVFWLAFTSYAAWLIVMGLVLRHSDATITRSRAGTVSASARTPAAA